VNEAEQVRYKGEVEQVEILADGEMRGGNKRPLLDLYRAVKEEHGEEPGCWTGAYTTTRRARTGQ